MRREAQDVGVYASSGARSTTSVPDAVDGAADDLPLQLRDGLHGVRVLVGHREHRARQRPQTESMESTRNAIAQTPNGPRPGRASRRAGSPDRRGGASSAALTTRSAAAVPAGDPKERCDAHADSTISARPRARAAQPVSARMALGSATTAAGSPARRSRTTGREVDSGSSRDRLDHLAHRIARARCRRCGDVAGLGRLEVPEHREVGLARGRARARSRARRCRRASGSRRRR